MGPGLEKLAKIVPDHKKVEKLDQKVILEGSWAQKPSKNSKNQGIHVGGYWEIPPIRQTEKNHDIFEIETRAPFQERFERGDPQIMWKLMKNVEFSHFWRPPGTNPL